MLRNDQKSDLDLTNSGKLICFISKNNPQDIIKDSKKSVFISIMLSRISLPNVLHNALLNYLNNEIEKTVTNIRGIRDEKLSAFNYSILQGRFDFSVKRPASSEKILAAINSKSDLISNNNQTLAEKLLRQKEKRECAVCIDQHGSYMFINRCYDSRAQLSRQNLRMRSMRNNDTASSISIFRPILTASETNTSNQLNSTPGCKL